MLEIAERLGAPVRFPSYFNAVGRISTSAFDRIGIPVAGFDAAFGALDPNGCQEFGKAMPHLMTLTLSPSPIPLGTPWSEWPTFDGVRVEAYPMPETTFIRVVALLDGRVLTFSDPTPKECETLGRLARLRELGFDDVVARVEQAIALQYAMWKLDGLDFQF